jgi:hypothetical protein
LRDDAADRVVVGRDVDRHGVGQAEPVDLVGQVLTAEIVFDADDIEMPVRVAHLQRHHGVDQLLQPLVHREPAECQDPALRRSGGAIGKLADVGAVLDDDGAVRGDLGELPQVRHAAADDLVIGHRRKAGHGLKPDLFQRGVIFRMEEAAMGGDHHRLAVQQPAPGQRIEEEVDGMHVDDVGIAKVAENLRGDRIAGAARPGNADDLDAADHLAMRQRRVLVGKQRIERDDADAVAVVDDLAGKIADHVLQTAAIGQELANDMDDQRRGGRRWLGIMCVDFGG